MAERHVSPAGYSNVELKGRREGGQKARGMGGEMIKRRGNSHKIALEEVLQLPLSCRIGQVADVEAAALSSAGRGGLVGGRLVIGRLADRGIAQSVCDVINGSIQVVGGVGGGSHDGGWWMKVVVRLSMTFGTWGPVVEERSRTRAAGWTGSTLVQ